MTSGEIIHIQDLLQAAGFDAVVTSPARAEAYSDAQLAPLETKALEGPTSVAVRRVRLDVWRSREQLAVAAEGLTSARFFEESEEADAA